MLKNLSLAAALVGLLACNKAFSMEPNTYKGRRIEARAHTVEVNGKQLERDLVVHPGAVVVLPVMEDGRIVMIRNHRPAVGETLWELPAGTLESGEDPQDAALRELEEETGYVTTSIEPMVDCFASPGYCTELFHLYRASHLKKAEQKLEEGEEITVHPMSMDEIRELMNQKKIRDAKSLVLLLMHDVQLQKHQDVGTTS